LIVLYVGSQLASTLLMSTTTDRTQRMIFIALPFVFVAFVWQFPAGLLVYWITTNLWTIVQQGIVRKRLGPMRPPGQESESLGDMIKKLSGQQTDDDRKGAPARGGSKAPSAREKVGVGGSEPKGRPSGPPPAPPRRKKKRSGRRR
jgi:YidC/Oxa1 family membrane protein insertase